MIAGEPSLTSHGIQVELPPDVHPLPESVSAYVGGIQKVFGIHYSLIAIRLLLLSQFVYPFSLESHILTLESSRRKTFAAHAARREAYLKARLKDKERRKRDALRRIAPGFEPQSTPLVPTRVASTGSPDDGPIPSPPPIGTASHVRTRSVMEDLVDQLAALDSTKS
jgi:hypothetical protein